jgi:hypothetical protein
MPLNPFAASIYCYTTPESEKIIQLYKLLLASIGNHTPKKKEAIS